MKNNFFHIFYLLSTIYSRQERVKYDINDEASDVGGTVGKPLNQLATSISSKPGFHRFYNMCMGANLHYTCILYICIHLI